MGLHLPIVTIALKGVCIGLCIDTCAHNLTGAGSMNK